MITRILTLFIAMALTWLPASQVLAGYGDGPGCGLGSDLIGKSGSKDILHQTLASSTNQIASQSFAITSQTWGCTNNGHFASLEHATVFANLNFDNLSQEMAQGGGEHLASLATILDVPAEQQAEFFALTQEKYPLLMQAGKESPAVMIKTLDDAMVAHPVLAKVSLTR